MKQQDPVIPEQPDLEFIAGQLRKPSGDFAANIAESMDKANKPLFELTLEAMQLKNHEKILEIGIGSGKFLNFLFSKASGLKVSGIDYSEEMVQKAREINKNAVASGKLSLLVGNSNRLPFDDHSFDKVFCNMVIYFWDEPAEHLKEVHRVLKPGGMFYSGFRPRKSMLQFPFVKHGFKLYSENEWESVLKRNGFELSTISRQNDPEIVDEAETIRLESVCMVAEKNELE
ncbi:class I SAM-dependent methyltransferase [soil metagenome]